MKKNILIVSAIALTLFSCAGKESYADAEMSANMVADAKQEIYEGTEEELALQEPGDVANDKIDIPEQNLENVNRKLIKEGSITFETSDTKSTKKLIEQVSKKYKGYLSEDNEFDYGYRIQHNVTIRIPSNNFDNLLNEISNSVNEIEDQNISVKDVTEEYVDVEARLKSKKVVEERYISLLSKAHNVGDILQVEHELGRIREEIERVRGG